MVSPHDLERYAIRGKLGKGRFATIYRGYDTKLGREVAIKAMKLTGPSLREVKELGQLDHPNLVRLYDIVEGGQCDYLIMECVKGTSLAAQSAALDEICDMISQVCNGLWCIHQHGMSHCAIRPDNLIRQENGVVKIADLGVGAHTANDKDGDKTPDYLAPEQKEGGRVDERTDVYSIGKVLDRLIDRSSDGAASALKGVVNKATQRDPAKRYRNAQELAIAMDMHRRDATKWQNLNYVIPELGIGLAYLERQLPTFSRGIALRLGGSLLWGLAFALSLQWSILGGSSYAPVFGFLYAPVLGALVAAFSPALAAVTMLVLLVPPLVAGFPSLGAVYLLLLLLFIPLIWSYPHIVLGAVFLVSWAQPIILMLFALITGTIYGILVGSMAPLWLGALQFVVAHVDSTKAYRHLLDYPRIHVDHGFLSSILQAEGSHMWELLLLVLEWPTDVSFFGAMMAVLLGALAGYSRGRGGWGCIVLVMVSGLTIVGLMPYLLWHWLFSLAIYFLGLTMARYVIDRAIDEPSELQLAAMGE